jgi:deoxyribonuclease-1-like protein
MAKFVVFIAVVAAAVGLGYFLMNYEVQNCGEAGQSTGWRIVPKKHAAQTTQHKPIRPTIRIGSFHLGRFDEAKAANQQIANILTHVLSQFDLVAVQGIRARNQGVLLRLADQLSTATGRHYVAITSPAQQSDGVEHYSAFLFDRDRVEVDRTTVQFVEDALGRFRFKPLVGWFRAKGPDARLAFTFWLINVENDPDPNRTPLELKLLAETYRKIRDGLPREDDVILLGDLEADDQHLGPLGKLLDVVPLLSGVPTTVRGTQLLDNILLNRRATTEFTGRAEAVDLLRDFNLTIPAALEISEHLPIMAEFSVYENNLATPKEE